MKIVNKQEFYELPKGTLFSHYRPVCIEGLMIKLYGFGGDSRDYGYQDLIGNIMGDGDDYVDILTSAQKNKTSFSLDFDCGQRDGMFDDDETFAIYEKEDIQQLIERLQSITW